MSEQLLLFSVILIICIIFGKITVRLGIPTLLVFIALGMLFGTDGIVKIAFSNYRLTEQLCTLLLTFIMFYGGFESSVRTEALLFPTGIQRLRRGIS